MLVKKNNTGFTFTEIIVVISLISIIGAISYSPIKSFISSTRSSTITTNIKKACALARIRALSDPNLHTGIFLDTASTPDSIIVFLDDNKDKLFTAGTDRQLVSAFSFSQSDTLIIAQGFPETIIFRGDGSAQASARFSVLSKHMRISTITVLASTGRINLTKETRSK